MDYTCRTRNLQSLIKDIERGKYSFDNPLQRKVGVWNRNQKSDLIDSLLRNYPINQVYAVKREDGVLDIIDGIQRLFGISSFCNNHFSLSKNLEPITINGIKYDLAGKKFKKLDEAVQDALLNCELQVYELSDCTSKDIIEMFRRQNNGVPLSISQKNIVKLNDELLLNISAILEHEFWTKTAITNGQIKKDETRDIVLSSIMLMSDYEIQGFKSKHIYDGFVPYFIALPLERRNAFYKRVTDAMNKLNELLPEKQKNFKKISIPMIVAAMDKCIDDKKSAQKFVEKLDQFFQTYDSNEDYKQYCHSGSASKDNVQGRYDYFKKMVNSL